MPAVLGARRSRANAALTRACDQLVITCVGRRSPFLHAMAEHVDFVDAGVTERLRAALAVP